MFYSDNKPIIKKQNKEISNGMKLCFIAKASSVHSLKWIKYFAERGHEIHWISLSSNIFGDIENVKFYFLKEHKRRILSVLLNLLKIRRLVKEINPDLLHVHYVGINGILASFSGFKPLVMTVWGSDIFGRGDRWWVRPFINHALKKAKVITCGGIYIKKKIEERGIEANKIKLVYWGINTERFSPREKEKTSLVIISLRSLEAVYNIHTLIKAIPLVPFNVKFVIGGIGCQGDELKKMAQGIPNVEFTGLLSQDQILKRLRSADIYVSTSLSDGGLSQCTSQAMSCQLPVIVTDLEVNKEWIKDGINGLFIPTKNPVILAEKIVTLIKDQELRQRLGREARKTIKQGLDYNREMKKVVDIYQSI